MPSEAQRPAGAWRGAWWRAGAGQGAAAMARAGACTQGRGPGPVVVVWVGAACLRPAGLWGGSPLVATRLQARPERTTRSRCPHRPTRSGPVRLLLLLVRGAAALRAWRALPERVKPPRARPGERRRKKVGVCAGAGVLTLRRATPPFFAPGKGGWRPRCRRRRGRPPDTRPMTVVARLAATAGGIDR